MAREFPYSGEALANCYIWLLYFTRVVEFKFSCNLLLPVRRAWTRALGPSRRWTTCWRGSRAGQWGTARAGESRVSGRWSKPVDRAEGCRLSGTRALRPHLLHNINVN